MFSREINWSEGFPNMVLSTEYSEAVNARYTFQPLRVSGTTLSWLIWSIVYFPAKRVFFYFKNRRFSDADGDKPDTRFLFSGNVLLLRT